MSKYDGYVSRLDPRSVSGSGLRALSISGGALSEVDDSDTGSIQPSPVMLQHGGEFPLGAVDERAIKGGDIMESDVTDDENDDDDFSEGSGQGRRGFFSKPYQALEQPLGDDSPKAVVTPRVSSLAVKDGYSVSTVPQTPPRAQNTGLGLSPASRRSGTPPLKSLASPEHITLRRIEPASGGSPATPAREPVGGASDSEEDELLPAMAAATTPSPSHLRRGVSRRARRQSVLPPSNGGRVMTKTQLENYRKSISGALDADANSDDSDDNEDDEEAQNSEEEEKRDRLRQRARQDAHLSVYRQKMTKVVGTQTTLSSIAQGIGSVAELNDDDDDSDEYEDVPLAILKAHGFPSGGAAAKLGKSMSTSNLSSMVRAGPSPPESTHDAPGAANGPVANPGYASTITGSTMEMDGKSFVAHRNSMPLPSVFGDKPTDVGRGLIGEIAKQEEERMQRRAQAMGHGLGLVNSAGPTKQNPPPPPRPNPLQQQLSQMMQMQQEMLSQIRQAQMAPPPQGPPANGPRALRKHFSSFDLGAGPGGAPSFNYRGSRPASVRSGFSGSGESYGRPRSAYNVSMRGGGPGRAPGRASAMPPPRRAVTEFQDDDDDDDDDADWQKMMEKRRTLKQQWSSQPSLA